MVDYDTFLSVLLWTTSCCGLCSMVDYYTFLSVLLWTTSCCGLCSMVDYDTFVTDLVNHDGVVCWLVQLCFIVRTQKCVSWHLDQTTSVDTVHTGCCLWHLYIQADTTSHGGRRWWGRGVGGCTVDYDLSVDVLVHLLLLHSDTDQLPRGCPHLGRSLLLPLA